MSGEIYKISIIINLSSVYFKVVINDGGGIPLSKTLLPTNIYQILKVKVISELSYMTGAVETLCVEIIVPKRRNIVVAVDYLIHITTISLFLYRE